MGLIDQLRVATSPSEVENFLIQGSQFTDASPKIQRRWRSVATRRLKELQTLTEAKAVAEKKAEKPTKSSKRQKA